ncbi:FAD-dependent oxidoreductase [Nonomuraea endophytica]|uniref:2-polyprenyl-6-methoxyphenol hydroxylase-like FAD-dependent oxidoreductase n=1 Tax=Nonomuraea endophytica TaxID=714136 RepID=A0A7W8EFW3_9ACTN|nr:NAD(P)/FAD-dependent oxidoreductase [Nonomuraea endophytica]MBB5077786.1 2-polyprenyl-6-methoxyphenol hydroxylase-like FAD-dependent oxidoreductase [Nonomuraea endophytica]
MSPHPLRVLIVGGGIGGLCLAQGLHAAGIDVAVFERDATPDARLQGYRLNIEPAGSRALHDCLPPYLWHVLVATAGDPGLGMGVFTERLRLLMREDPLPAERDASERTHAVSRVTLRRLLLAGLDDIVHFGKEFTGYRQNAAGTVTALFADGTSATGDLLVGADGANSRVRRQLLPHARRFPAPGFGIGGKLPLGDGTAWLPEEMTSTKNMFLPKRDFLFTAVFRRRDTDGTTVEHVGDQIRTAGLNPDLLVQDAKDDDYVMWAYVAHRRVLPADLRDAPAGGQRLRELVASRLTDWHPDLREMITQTPADTIERFDFATAEPVKPWPTTNVTVLGDAAHSMPPVGGLGGNAALYDADALRRALIPVGRGEADLLPAVAAYEREMLKNGFAAVRAATMYLRLATLPSRAIRTIARMFFRVCGALPPLRRAIFSD